MAKNTHQVPLDDWIEHEISEFCVCGPKVVEQGRRNKLIQHYSLDGRENKKDQSDSADS